MRLILSFIAGLVGFSSLASAHTIPESRLSEAWWKKRFEQHMKTAAKGDHDLLFIGDSIMQGFERAGKKTWEKYYAPRKALNFGVSGDRTEHVIWRLNQTDFSKVQPKVAIIMIGTNNTGHKLQKPKEIAEGIAEIVEIVRKNCPQTKILLLGLFPRGVQPDDVKRVNNVKVNKLIQGMHDGKYVHYLDISKSFLNKDNILTKEVMPDGLHPKEKGYEIWGQAIEAKLTELGLPLPLAP